VIQPLVLRARLGECVVINLRNDLTRPPVGGPANANMFQFPGGVPSVSVDMQGVSYNAQASHGGQAVGNTNGSTMAAPGQTRQYRFFLDPVMGEGTKIFRSGGESTQLTAHGLFGALIAEPAGARWFDPNSGAERTNDANWSNWEAMIQAAGQPTFREFAILYHEIGDEDFNLRRPLREPFGTPGPDPFQPGRQVGGSLPMIDAGTGVVATPFNIGGGTNAYRPSSRALNYRSDSFFRRLQHETLLVAQAGGNDAAVAQEQHDNKSLTYSSYTYGDPSTPIPRSYLGEPTKTRLAHVGFEQLHVHHLHGGATRWRQNPRADDTEIDAGLDKTPIQNAQSIRLDSQTISPEESFSLEHECGAGGCQQAAGDFLYHCHIAHHYVAGMWGMWRVFDTRQADLAALPGRTLPAAAVNSAGLIGRTLSDGRTVVAGTVNTATQIGVETLVESQLPPPGQRLDKQDATVWDWLKTGPANAPVYVGEQEDTRVWENYRSPTPGQRPAILFNPVNGRYAYPLFKPHLAQRPPFAGGEHSGTPWLGPTATNTRPDGLCPQASTVRNYNITAVSIDNRHPAGGIRMTDREVDSGGMLYTLNEDKQALLNGTRPAEPLAIRSNVADCVAITFGNEIDNVRRVANGHHELAKTNMHTHFVQFDPQASDGVITGFSYEQSVFPTQRDGRTSTAAVAPGATTVAVSQVNRLRTGIAIAVGLGTPNIEIRTITAINGNTLTLNRALANSHAAGVPVTVEFTQHRWFSDVDSGTVFWHDHVDGMTSWAHGLFAAHIIEPPGSTYHDPRTGAQVRSGTIVDIRTPNSATVGTGQSGSFREFMIFLHNGRPAASDDANRKFGQECEEGSINLRAAPFGERTPPGTLITDATGAPVNVDPTTTQQRFEFNGARCRNAYNRTAVAGNQNANTVEATVTAVDPYVFSSVVYGEPRTPLLRAYAGDDVVIRTIGLGERGEALRIQGHQFRMERFNASGQLMDTAVTGISERFDYVLDGGAGGPNRMAGDYLYYSTRTFALESGAWGIFRVHDRAEPDLQPLPGNSAPPSGNGFPILNPNTAGNPQANPGAPPPASVDANGVVNTAVVSNASHACPTGSQTQRIYSITAFDHPLPSSPFPDSEGIVYALTSDVAAIQAGTKAIEPLVLRANQGDCVIIRLRNRIDPTSLYGGTRAGFDLGQLQRNPQLAAGSAIGLNPDTTVAANQNIEYRFLANQEVGTTIFQNLGSPASLRHGAYGMLIVEPTGSVWRDSVTGATLSGTLTSTQAVIDPPGSAPSFREFALMLQTTDQHYGRSIVEYVDVIAGNGINAPRAVNRPTVPVPGAPPGTGNNEGTLDKGYNHVNYRTEPLTERVGLTNAPGPAQNPSWWQPGFAVSASPYTALTSVGHGDPATPVFRAFAGDRVVFRVGIGASDHLHSFTISGHQYPLEPGMWNGTTDLRSQLMTSRTITAGQTLNAWPVGGAGGPLRFAGDYAYRDSRQPWTQAGMWGILRVQVAGSGGIIPLP
jgi:manganese oxidase